MLTMEEKLELLERLSECINKADSEQLFEIGDTLFGVISDLKQEWDIDD